MPIVLPLVAFLAFFQILRQADLAWRTAILASMIFLGTCVALITELLSALRILTSEGVTVSWLFICIAALAYSVIDQTISLETEP